MAAMENPRIRAHMIDASEFPELSDRYQVRTVPLTVIHGKRTVSFAGRYPEGAFLAELEKAIQ